MKKGNDEGFPKDRGLVTKEKRKFDVLASGVMGLKLSDEVQLVAILLNRLITRGRRPQ